MNEHGRMTFVLFLADGSCALVRRPDDRLELATGEMAGDEDELDAMVRIPLETAGFRADRFHPLRWDGDHLYAWLEGDRDDGRRPHTNGALAVMSPEDAARRLRAQGSDHHARCVSAAARSYRSQAEARYYVESMRTIELVYLRATTVEGGSGFEGTAAEWRAQREPVVAGIQRDGTFLDAGCANGLLMESARRWCAERGVHVEPYGIDLAPGLVELARRRLPQWAERIWVGNAVSWVHPPACASTRSTSCSTPCPSPAGAT